MPFQIRAKVKFLRFFQVTKMDARIKLVGFILLFTASIVLSYSLEKFVFVDKKDSFWVVFVPVTVLLPTSILGVFVKNIKELALYTLFLTITFVMFLFSTIYFDRRNTENIFAFLFKNQESAIRFSLIIFISFITILSLLLFGMLLSYLNKRIFKRQKS